MFAFLLLIGWPTESLEVYEWIGKDLETRQVSELPYTRYIYVYVNNVAETTEKNILKAITPHIFKVYGKCDISPLQNGRLIRISFDSLSCDSKDKKKFIEEFEIIASMDPQFCSLEGNKFYKSGAVIPEPLQYEAVNKKLGMHPVVGLQTFLTIIHRSDFQKLMDDIKAERGP